MVVSVIISTYNSPECLELSVRSVMNQVVLPEEIIIADDGSTAETRVLVERLQSESPVPIVHVWHEDKGFRVGAIRNKAIAASKGEYIVQIDGDIIVNRNFIADHLAVAKSGFFLQGSRVLLKQSFTARILKTGGFSRGEFFKEVLRRGIKNWMNSFRLSFLRNFYAKCYSKNSLSSTRGCNVSFWKSDLLMINGYDEDFEGWGKEDTELCVRLFNNQVYEKRLKFGGIAYHLYHKENTRDSLEKNCLMLQETIDQKKKFVVNGISKK